MSHDAAHAKEAAKAELAATEDALSNECAKREKELSDRQALWRIKQELAAASSQAAAAAKAGAPAAELKAERSRPAMSINPTVMVEASRLSNEGEMSFEAALRKIKEATGVSEVDDVIMKFSAQKETAKNLAAMTLEAQTRIDSLNARIEAAKVQAESLKYTAGAAPAAAGGSRRVMDELEAQLADATARHDRLHARQERVAKLLVALRAGAEHLAERLESVALAAGTEAPRGDGADATLALCALKLARMLRDLGGDAQAAPSALADPARLASLAFPLASELSQSLRRETQRMDQAPPEDDDDEDEALQEDDDGEGPDEVLDRNTVKVSSERAMGISKQKPKPKALTGSASMRKPAGAAGMPSTSRGSMR